MAIKRNFILSSGIGISSDNLYLVGSTASTSSSTGALIVTGGAGIGSSLNVGGRAGIGTNTLSAATLTVNTVTSTNPGIRVDTVASQSRGAIEVTSTAGSGGTVFVIYPQTTSASSKMKLHGGTINHVDGREPAISIGSYNTPGSGIVIRGTNGSDASPLLEIQNNPGSILFSVGGAGSVVVASTVSSTSTSTGAITVTGGVGIGGSIFGGSTISAADNIEVKSAKEVRFNNSGNTFYTGFKAGANASNTTYTLPIAFPGTGTSILQSDASGTLSWVAMTSGGGSGTVNNGTLNSIPYYPAAGTAITGSSSFTNVGTGISITYTTPSTSSTTGALVVTGGVGIGGSLHVNNKVRLADEVTLTSISSNALSILGSGSVSYTWTVGTTLTSSRYNLGLDLCLVPIGGSQSAIQTYWGMQLVGNNQNAANTYSPTAVGARDAFGVLIPNQQAASVGLAVIAHASQTGDLQIWTTPSGLATTTYLAVKSNGQLYSYVSIASTSASAGSLVVTGGAGVGQSVSIGGRLQMFNGANYTAFVSGATGNTTYTLPVASPGSGTSILQSTSAGVLSWIAPSSVGIAVSGASDGFVQFKSGSALGGTNSLFFDSTLLGLRVSGFPGGEATSGTSAALKVEQSVGSFNGNVNGTMIAVNASTGFNGDLINLQLNGVTKFKVSASGAIGMSSDIVTTGVVSAGDLTNSTSTTTGALKVSGGAGITGNLFAGGNVRVNSSTASTSTATGALTVQGGLGVSGQLSMVSAALGFTGVQVNPSMAFIGNTSSAPITLTVLTDNSLSWEGTSGQLFAIDNNLTTGDIFSVSDISGLPIINASAGQTVTINEFGGYTQIGGGTINSTSTSTGSLVIAGGLGMTGNANIGGTVRITSTTQSINTGSGALVVSGGAGIGQSLFVGGNFNLTGTFYSGTNTFTKTQNLGDISLDNGTVDTPAVTFYWGNNRNIGIDTYYSGSGTTRFRITKELNEAGGTELWSVDRNGIVTQTAWDVGEVINTRVYNNTDLNMSATTTINSTTYTNVATITYTPKSSTSHLWIEFDAHYDFSNGTTTDDFFSRITVGGSAIVEKNQIMVGQVGGGTRSGTIFPISGRYTNTGTSGIAITVQAKWGSADDNIRVYGSSTSGYMRIQEIGR